MDPTTAGPTLRDIHLPPSPEWWPPAPGWWIVATLVMTVFALFVWRSLRARRRHRRRLVALDELVTIRCDWQTHGDAARLAAALSNYLRRLSRIVDPASATLTGTSWLVFLDRYGEGFRDTGCALLDAPYQPCATFDAEALYDLVRRHAHRVVTQELARV